MIKKSVAVFSEGKKNKKQQHKKTQKHSKSQEPVLFLLHTSLLPLTLTVLCSYKASLSPCCYHM